MRTRRNQDDPHSQFRRTIHQMTVKSIDLVKREEAARHARLVGGNRDGHASLGEKPENRENVWIPPEIPDLMRVAIVKRERVISVQNNECCVGRRQR